MDAGRMDGGRTDEVTTLAGIGDADLDAFLVANSGLPGPRANLALARAAADRADEHRIHSWAHGADEYLALCGALGLGRLRANGELGVETDLLVLASDPRWRVREGVAMALQRVGDADPAALFDVARTWAGGPPYIQRAAIAGVCEPRLVRSPETARAALSLLDRLTASVADATPVERRSEGFRVLRQALGYCWSVAVAGLPDEGFPAFREWVMSTDADVRWIVRSNLAKARLQRADAAATSELRRLAAG